MTQYWKTKDGTKMAFSDMTDEHLQNAIDMISRRRGTLLDTIEKLGETGHSLSQEKIKRKGAKEKAAKQAKQAAMKRLKERPIVAMQNLGRKFRDT